VDADDGRITAGLVEAVREVQVPDILTPMLSNSMVVMSGMSGLSLDRFVDTHTTID
jgi:hypothetical protein